MTVDPEFWTDSERAQGIMREIQIHKNRISRYNAIKEKIDDLEVLEEFYKAGDLSEEEIGEKYQETVEQVEDVEFRLAMDQEEDELSAIIEINAGAGGTEACDWAAMLQRMYLMYGDKAGYKVRTTAFVDGDVAGIKSCRIEIAGSYAYGMLKSENGVHRLVRVSPFNSQGKRMTSFASVFVHPLIDDSIEIEVNPADLDWDTFRASGAGGQHVNKTESAVRLRHAPSGIVVECQEERSQHLNREKAIVYLKSRLYQAEIKRRQEEKQKVEAGKMKNEWGSQIRSYVLDDRRVKDHRTNFSNNNTDAVLDGDIEGFLKAYLTWNGE